MELEPLVQKIMADATDHTRGFQTVVNSYKFVERAAAELGKVLGKVEKDVNKLAQANERLGNEAPAVAARLEQIALIQIRLAAAAKEMETIRMKGRGATEAETDVAYLLNEFAARKRQFKDLGLKFSNVAPEKGVRPQAFEDFENTERMHEQALKATVEAGRARIRGEEQLLRLNQMNLAIEEQRQAVAIQTVKNQNAIGNRVQALQQQSFGQALGQQANQQAQLGAAQRAAKQAVVSGAQLGAAQRAMHNAQLGAAQRAMQTNVVYNAQLGAAQRAMHNAQLGAAQRALRTAFQQYGSTTMSGPPGPEDPKKTGKGGGFGRWWLAGAAAHIGSQLGPLGNIGGDIIAGGLIGGPVGAGLGAMVGTVQAGINIFQEFMEVGKRALNSIIGYAENLAHKFVGLSQDILETGANFQKMRITFEAITQNKEVGGQLFSNIKQMAGFLPYTVDSLSRVAQTLLSMGVSSENTTAALIKLGTIAHGDEDKLRNLALVLGEVQGEGVLSFRRLRQLASAGIGLEDIARATGKSIPEVTALMHKNEAGAEMLIQTLNYVTGPLGRFGKLNAEVLASASGQWQLFQNTLQVVKGEIGEALIGRMDLTSVIGNATSWLKSHAAEIQEAFLTVWDRIQVASEVVIDAIRLGWASVSMGSSLDSITSMIPSAEKVRAITQEILDILVKIAEVIGSAVALYIKMEMLSIRIKLTTLDWGTSIFGGSENVKNLVSSFDKLEAALTRIGALDIGGKISDAAKSFGIGVEVSGISTVGQDRTQRIQTYSNELAALENKDRTLLENKAISLEKYGNQYQATYDKTIRENLKRITEISREIHRLEKEPSGSFIGPRLPTAEELAQQQQLIPKPALSGKAQKMMDDLYEQMQKGFTPLEHMQKQFKLISEIEASIKPQDFIGPLKEGQFRVAPEVQKGLAELKFEEYAKAASKYKAPAESLTPAAYAGSPEALDIINKSNLANRTMLEQVHDVLKDALREQEEHNRHLQEMQDLINNGLIPALPGAGGPG